MKRIFLIIFVLLISKLNAQKILNDTISKLNVSNYIDSISINLNYKILNHNNYINYYSEKDLVSLFVIYDLNPKYNNKINYSSIFIKDKKLNVSPGKYYTNSGYDRGHLFNAEDASLFDYETFKSSYYITNATPQKPEFNGGIWKILEKETRNLAKKDSLIIITGTDIFKEDLFKLQNKVLIPNYYFKVIINLSKKATNIYYIPNKLVKNKLTDFLITKKLFFDYTGIKLKDEY